MYARKQSIQEFIDSNVERIPECGCHIWMLNLLSSGYGRVGDKGKTYRLHRLVWELVNGPIPEGMNVLHSCDIPCCCNPHHLFLGTHAENKADCVKKLRHAFGARNGRTKLSDTEVLHMRDDTRPCTVVAKEYNVSPALVSKIRRRELWPHL